MLKEGYDLLRRGAVGTPYVSRMWSVYSRSYTVYIRSTCGKEMINSELGSWVGMGCPECPLKG